MCVLSNKYHIIPSLNVGGLLQNLIYDACMVKKYHENRSKLSGTNQLPKDIVNQSFSLYDLCGTHRFTGTPFFNKDASWQTIFGWRH